MTIIEYAEKLGYKLNSAQMMLLNKMQEAKEHDLQLFICCPPRIGKMKIADIVEKKREMFYNADIRKIQ